MKKEALTLNRKLKPRVKWTQDQLAGLRALDLPPEKGRSLRGRIRLFKTVHTPSHLTCSTQATMYCLNCRVRVRLILDSVYIDRRRCPLCDAVEGHLFRLPPHSKRRSEMRRFTLAIRKLRWAAMTLLLCATVALAQPTQDYTATVGCGDDQDGDISASAVWTSDVQPGDLGTGSGAVLALIGGTHQITATCTDSGGLTASGAVQQVVAVNTPPYITTPPALEEVASAAIEVTPDAAISGVYGLKLTPTTDGLPQYIYKPEDSVVPDWGEKLKTTVKVRMTDAVLADGFELVIMRGQDVNDAPLWDLILVGTAQEPEVKGRVYDASATLTTPSTVLTTAATELAIEWHQDQSLGLIRLYVNRIITGEIHDLDTDRDMTRLMLGMVDGSVGLSGFLALDDLLVESIS